jgi:predicted RNase H-like HicB family nuclease
MPAIKQKFGHIIVTGEAYREGKHFVSVCRELGVASCGDTVEEALENLKDAIHVHISALVETRQLTKVLRERNIRIHPLASSDEVQVRVRPERVFSAYSPKVPLGEA